MARNTESKSDLYVVGLTGGIGSGKTTVANAFEKLGAAVLSADSLAREVVSPGSAGLSEVAQHFGKEYLLEDGSLNRKKLGNLVFSNPKKRIELEQILHPRIRALFQVKLKELKAKYQDMLPLVVYEIPLLFESGREYPDLKSIVVVSTPRDECIKRIIERDGGTRELAEQKLASQLPDEEKRQKADYVIENKGSKDDLQQSAEEVYNKLLKQANITYAAK